MEKTKQILKTFTFDEEALESLSILKNRGFNISFLIREFIKQEARKQASKA
jgi:post-segregation antitoxin (ccd killing protein)